MGVRLFAGDRDPKVFDLVLSAEDVDVNFTDVIAWELRVRLPDGSKATWTVDDVIGLTATAVTLRHVLAPDGADLPAAGNYDIVAWLTMSALGNLQSDPLAQYVEESFGARV